MSFFGFGPHAAAVPPQPTFDEAMCQRFNQFYDVAPLPQGRVRPKFTEVSPPLELVACSDYNPLISEGSRTIEITPNVQTIFIDFFKQFENLPGNLSMNCGTTLKVLKIQNPLLFDSPLKWSPASPRLNKHLVPIMCKQNFLYGIVEYVTKPVVLSWNKYIQDNQQPLDIYQEEYLSTLLQCKLLEGMINMVEQTSYQYVPTPEEFEHFQQFKQQLQQLQGKLQQLQEQLELEKLRKFRLNNPVKTLSEKKQIAMTEEGDKIFELGGSKYKRQSKRQRSKRQRRKQSKRRQRQRQKTKKYYK